MTAIKIFGIRHHGAGSTRRMLQAIVQFEPDAIALEMPADSSGLIRMLHSSQHVPPVAFLYYNEQLPEQAIYLPLAVFSPEYQVLCYADKYSIPLHCIDLPSSVSLSSGNFIGDPEKGLIPKHKKMIADPIGFLAQQAGFSDAEHWWESSFEQWTNHEQLFDVIQMMMTELREQSKGLDDSETLLREVHMRCAVRALIQKKIKKLAIVCGAWHGPVLTEEFLNHTKNEQIPEMKSISTKSCIIPWTYKHLSQQEGYNAGVRAPIWHEALYTNHETAPSVFLTHAARSLRKLGVEIPPSASIDAHLLSSNLALLRELPGPGLDELLEAAYHIFPANAQTAFEKYKLQLMCGEVTGKIDLKKINLPFCQIFHQQLKLLKLNRFWKDAHSEHLHLDLRKEHQLAISQFLHYCALIELSWADQIIPEAQSLGNFHEYWNFHFHPELEIALIQVGLYGNTLEMVCRNLVKEKLNTTKSIDYISKCLDHSLKSGMDFIWPLMEERLNDLLIYHHDIIELSKLVSPLQLAITYGSLHKIAAEFAEGILQKLIPKLVLAFPQAAQGIQDDRAKQLIQSMLSIQSFYDHRDPNVDNALWVETLRTLAESQSSAPRLRGKSWSMLLEKKCCTRESFISAFNFEFSLDMDIPKAAFWFEGFLLSPSSLYLMHPEIANSLNKWIRSIDTTDFEKYLPLLRRSFSQIPQGERKRLLKGILTEFSIEHSLVSTGWKTDEQRKVWVDLFLKNEFPIEPF